VKADETINDGRSLRRNRNSEAILEAVLELFIEHNLDPSPNEVAERAGVSLRTVYRHLGNSDLVRAGMDRVQQRQRAEFQIPDLGAGPLEERIAVLVRTRVRGVRANAAVIAAADYFAASRPEIRRDIEQRRLLLRKQTAAQFAPELRGGGSTAQATLDAVDALTQIEPITYYLDDLGYGEARTIGRLTTALTALLGPRT
jgi:AcrR family transcriptional regulator